MEVSPGYKQTEVGIIPVEWHLTPLVELIDETRSIRYGIVQPGKFDPMGRYMVRGQDYSNGWVAASELFRVSPQVEEPYKNARVRAGDVVITIVGASTGHIEVIPQWLDGANLTQTTARLAVHPSRAFSGFVKCYLQSASGQRQVANYLKGAAQPGLNCGDIEKFQIPLPPTLSEQRAIATALSDVDALLGALDRLIAKKRDLKQAAMQQLLTGQTRLPGFQDKWEMKRLGEVAPLQRGFDLPNPQLKRGPYPVVYSNGIMNHHAAFQVKGPGVVTGRSGTIGTVTFVVDDYWPHNTSLWVTSFKGNDPKFVYYLYTRLGFDRFATGSGVPTLNRNDVHAFHVMMPATADEQTAIAEVLSDMDGEIAALVLQRDKTGALKQGMMQELLTGKTRLISSPEA